MRRPVYLAVTAALLLAGCERYHPLPLADHAALAASLSGLDHDGVAIDRPLDVADIVALAVRNAPALRAARAQHGVAGAQVLQAGLLPNPSVNPLYAGNVAAPNALNNAWAVALSYDVRALILRPSLLRSARAARDQVDAQLLWQEWQVIGQARLLAVDLIEQARQRRVLAATRDLLERRYRHSAAALAVGNATLATTIPDLAALQAARSSLDTVDRSIQANRQLLASLLGLEPTVVLALAPTPELPPLEPDAVRQRLPQLATYRPDLVALRMGYRSQDEQVRASIVGQFPAFVIGLVGGVDNTHDYTIGPQPSFDLPIFNHNQGQIAIARASRQLLHDQYEERLQTATGEVEGLLAAIDLEQHQLDATRRDVALTSGAAADAGRAFDAGNLDELSYVSLVSAQFGKQQQILTLEQAVLDQRVAIATLIGAGLPALAEGQGRRPWTPTGPAAPDPHDEQGPA